MRTKLTVYTCTSVETTVVFNTCNTTSVPCFELRRSRDSSLTVMCTPPLERCLLGMFFLKRILYIYGAYTSRLSVIRTIDIKLVTVSRCLCILIHNISKLTCLWHTVLQSHVCYNKSKFIFSSHSLFLLFYIFLISTSVPFVLLIILAEIPEEAQAIIDKALESGSLKQRNLIVTITGIMGAGKTCFLRQLFSLKPPSKYSSTGVAEKSCRGLMHHVAEMGSFQILSHNEVHEFLAPFLSSAMVLTDTTTSTSEEEVSEFQTQSSVPYLGSNSSTSAPFIRGIEGESPYEPIQSVPPTTESLSINREAQPVPEKSFASEAINFALRAPKTAAGTCLQLLDVIDTGGQPEFMETMPCVIHNSNLTALVLNIAQSLDTCPKVTFHRKGKGFRRGIPFPLTNRQIIENLARTMQAKRCIQEYGQKSKLMVIFTHCDSLWRWRIASTIAAVNREIKKIFIPAFQNELIVYRSVDEIGFPVNCLSPDAKDKIVFQQIRENISKVSVGNEMMVPPSFLMFEHDLMRYAKELGRDILSFNECMQVGVHLNMSEKVVQAALIYFHQHNIFLYFPKVLPRLVFTDPQVPLNFVNNVVAFSYLVNCGEFAGLPAEYSLSLRNGIILEEMLTKEPLSSCLVPGIYESVHAITLFKHLRVIAVINEDECDNHELSFFNDKAAKPVSISFRKQRFLMPCMLPIEKNVARCLPQSPVSKFVVRFNNDCVPNGVFGGSIATLLTVHGWKICKKEDGSPQCMTHDIVTLHDPLIPARITYMNATRHCEIYIDARNFETCVNACPLIRSTIFSALHSTFEVMHFDCTVEDAFPCPCKVSNKLAHAAITCNFKDAVHLKCSISGEPLGLAEEKCVVWLAPVQQPTQTEATGTAQSGKPHICTTLVNRQSLATTTKPLTTEAQPLQEKKERLASTEDKPTMPELIRFETSLDVADDKQTVWLSQVPTPAKVTNTASSVEKLSPIVDTGIPSVKPYRLQKKKERLASTEDKPTLPELIAFKTQSGNINIMEGIGMHYHQLGPLLLKDGDGSVTDAFIDQYHLNAARINHEILKRWLGGTGLKPV